MRVSIRGRVISTMPWAGRSALLHPMSFMMLWVKRARRGKVAIGQCLKEEWQMRTLRISAMRLTNHGCWAVSALSAILSSKQGARQTPRKRVVIGGRGSGKTTINDSDPIGPLTPLVRKTTINDSDPIGPLV